MDFIVILNENEKFEFIELNQESYDGVIHLVGEIEVKHFIVGLFYNGVKYNSLTFLQHEQFYIDNIIALGVEVDKKYYSNSGRLINIPVSNLIAVNTNSLEKEKVRIWGYYQGTGQGVQDRILGFDCYKVLPNETTDQQLTGLFDADRMPIPVNFDETSRKFWVEVNKGDSYYLEARDINSAFGVPTKFLVDVDIYKATDSAVINFINKDMYIELAIEVQ